MKYPVCVMCKGNMQNGQTAVTVDYGSGVIVIRNVPAMICDQCGAEWIEDKEAEEVERMVTDAKEKKAVVEVMTLSKQITAS